MLLARTSGMYKGFLASATRRLRQRLTIITGVWKHGTSFTGFGTTTLWRVLATGAVAYLWSANNTTLRIAYDCVNISKGRKNHGSSLRFEEKGPWAYLSMKSVLGKRSTARSLTTPNHTSMNIMPIWRCNKMTPSDLVCCSLAFLNFWKSWHPMRDDQVGCTKYFYIKFGLASMSITYLSLFTLCACRPTLEYVLVCSCKQDYFHALQF